MGDKEEMRGQKKETERERGRKRIKKTR